METTFYISVLLTYCIFIFLGYHLSRKFEKPFNLTKWILIIGATIIAGWIRIGKVVDIFNFTIQFNWCLQGFGLGFILGLLKNKFKDRIAIS